MCQGGRERGDIHYILLIPTYRASDKLIFLERHRYQGHEADGEHGELGFAVGGPVTALSITLAVFCALGETEERSERTSMALRGDVLVAFELAAEV